MIGNRRKFIQTLAIGSAAFIAQACSKKADDSPNVSGELGADTPAANEEMKAVSPTDPTAQALGYAENAASVDPSLKVEKNGVAGAEQNCANCAFYSGLESIENGGKCQLIMSGYVKAGGWCKSWAKKQG